MARAAKKPKVDDDEEEVVEDKKKAAETATAGGAMKVDKAFAALAGDSATVATDDDGNAYGAMLTFQEGNSDKFFALQIIKNSGKFTTCSRWGRAGTSGQQQTQGPFPKLDAAVKVFEQKFKDKTGHTWDAALSGDFEQKSGKYDYDPSGYSGGGDDDGDGDGDGDEDDEAPKKAAKKPPAKKAAAKKKAESDDEGEDEEEEAPSKKAPAKKAPAAKKKAKSEDEDEDEEEEAPSKKAPAKKAPAAKKKAKSDDEDEDDDDDDDDDAPKSKGKAAKVPKSPVKYTKAEAPDVDEKVVGEIDPAFKESVKPKSAKMYVDEQGRAYDAMLTMTEGNADKYYLLQLIAHDGKYSVFTRWGRTGASGQNQTQGPMAKLDAAISAFDAKFKAKSGSPWSAILNGTFKRKKGSYDCQVHPEGSSSGGNAPKRLKKDDDSASAATQVAVLSSASAIGELKKIIQSKPQIVRSMLEQLRITTPSVESSSMLESLTSMQIRNAQVALEDMQKLLNLEMRPANEKLAPLSQRFYNALPKALFSVQEPIRTKDQLHAMMDLVSILSQFVGSLTECDSLDLGSQLVFVDPQSNEFKTIQSYATDTQDAVRNNAARLIGVFALPPARKEPESFTMDLNRKLLWLTASPVNCVDIIANGPRPISGRVGKGIYLASELSRASLQAKPFVDSTSVRYGTLFLAEVALGKEYSVTRDMPEMISPPSGFDSVVAQGRMEPGFATDVELKVGDKHFIALQVPQNKAKVRQRFSVSAFSQTEYVVYKESQLKPRFLCLFQWPEEHKLAPPSKELFGAAPSASGGAPTTADVDMGDGGDDDDDDDEDDDDD